MRAVFDLGKRSEEILDLTAPAHEGDEGIVARWLRESLARSAESTYAADAAEEGVA